MKIVRYFAAALLLACFACGAAGPREGGSESGGQDSDDVDITFASQLEARVRRQVRRFVSEYNLDPWIFTRVVNVDVADRRVFPHSHPVLTLTTESEYLRNDLRQLSSFLHEQIHWFGESNERAMERAMADLRRLYPRAPDENSPYLHLLVGWLQLDALTQLVMRRTRIDSCVGFLIERYGMDRFKNLLRQMDEEPFEPIYAEVYGKSLEVLEGEWRAIIT